MAVGQPGELLGEGKGSHGMDSSNQLVDGIGRQTVQLSTSHRTVVRPALEHLRDHGRVSATAHAVRRVTEYEAERRVRKMAQEPVDRQHAARVDVLDVVDGQYDRAARSSDVENGLRDLQRYPLWEGLQSVERHRADGRNEDRSWLSRPPSRSGSKRAQSIHIFDDPGRQRSPP
ncbi:hypothetical protein [Streptomyces sp. NPDC058583]|uniref:hypothetical protein n=1 Tax=unclassified Streptomyces TaxID=2593676 RepID=UPI00365A05E7